MQRLCLTADVKEPVKPAIAIRGTNIPLSVLLCGTSTGGIIAILLGVLYLDVDTTLNLYRILGRTIFGNKWRKNEVVLSGINVQ